MGTSSVLKLIDSNHTVIKEEDFDKSLSSGLREIADSLPRSHPFRKLMDILDWQVTGEDIDEEFSPLAGDDEDSIDFTVIPNQMLNEFRAYTDADATQLWPDLFPARMPGMINWFKYQMKMKPVERAYRFEPHPPQMWYRDSFEALISLVRRAIAEHCCILRTYY